MKHICISHAPLRYTPSVPYEFYSPAPIPGVQTTVISDDVWGDRWNGRVLSEYLQLFVLAEQWAGWDGMIHLIQYRRILTPISPPSHTHQEFGSLCLPPHAAPPLVPSAERLEATNLPTFGAIMQCRVAEQFAAYHHLVDLQNLAKAMVISGAFTPKEASQFYNAKLLIGSPSLGIYPSAMLLEHLSILRQVWNCFYDRFFVPRQDYNRRVGGFLMERLHSYLLLRHFDQNPDAKANIWYRVLLERAVRMQ